MRRPRKPRAPQGARIPKFVALSMSPAMPAAGDSTRRSLLEFAALVIRRLATNATRMAVVNESGRPAMVACNERLFDLIAKDHPIVGVYTAQARLRDIYDDLRAAGL